MSHPFGRLSHLQRKRLFLFFFFSTMILMIIMNIIGAPLNTEAAPYGIISFELAGNPSEAVRIVNSWDQVGQLHAALSLGLDYLFMLVYSTTIALACVWASDMLHNSDMPLMWLGVSLAWGQWLAALLDAVENFVLWKILLGSLNSPLPEIARWAATGKFILIFLGLIYALYAFALYLLGRWMPKQ